MLELNSTSCNLLLNANTEGKPMHTAAIIHAEHAAEAANDNFAFAIGQRVEYAAGGMASVVMARFTSDAGRQMYEVMNADDRRLRTFLAPALRAA